LKGSQKGLSLRDVLAGHAQFLKTRFHTRVSSADLLESVPLCAGAGLEGSVETCGNGTGKLTQK